MGRDAVRVGIVGAGYIAAVHSAAYRTVAGTYPGVPRSVELVAAADANPDVSGALQRAWGWERTGSDWREITRADDIDVVDVSVPNVFHAEIAIDALRHGKHVICEKPLAQDVGSATAMRDAAAEADGLAQVCFYYRTWPAVAWARDLIAGGAIGEVKHFRGWMLQDYAADPAQSLGWRARRADAGAGALGDLGSHVIDLARSLVGEIASVSALTRTTVQRPEATDIDDHVSMLVDFEPGASGVIEASWAARGHKCDLGFDVIADGGALRFNWERANEVEVLQGDPGDPLNGFRRVLVGPGLPDADRFVGVGGQGLGYRDAFTIGVGHVLEAIARDENAIDPSFEDGLQAARVVAAALESADAGRWTVVDRS